MVRKWQPLDVADSAVAVRRVCDELEEYKVQYSLAKLKKSFTFIHLLLLLLPILLLRLLLLRLQREEVNGP
jgi:hypothetical protein